MRWCSLQTNEHDLQAIMYPIICKYPRLNINNGNKVPVFPGYICNRWQNMIVQPSQTHNHGKIWQQWERYYFVDGGNRRPPNTFYTFASGVCCPSVYSPDQSLPRWPTDRPIARSALLLFVHPPICDASGLWLENAWKACPQIWHAGLSSIFSALIRSLSCSDGVSNLAQFQLNQTTKYHVY